MGLELAYFEGQSPLDEDEKEGLIIKTISTRGELDEFEQRNIELAVAWTLMENAGILTMYSRCKMTTGSRFNLTTPF